MKELEVKSDIELMTLKVETEQVLSALSENLKAINYEFMRRVTAFKEATVTEEK
jgi:hypothetical protein